MTNKYDEVLHDLEAYEQLDVRSPWFMARNKQNIKQALKLASKLERGEVSDDMVFAFNDTVNISTGGDVHNPKNVFKAMAKAMLEEVEER